MCINLHSSLPLQHRKLSPGWHFVFKPFECVSFHVTTREQVLDVPPQQVCKHDMRMCDTTSCVLLLFLSLYIYLRIYNNKQQQCYTLDNAPLRADAVVYMRINNIEMARYNVQDVMNAILNLCLSKYGAFFVVSCSS